MSKAKSKREAAIAELLGIKLVRTTRLYPNGVVGRHTEVHICGEAVDSGDARTLVAIFTRLADDLERGDQ